MTTAEIDDRIRTGSLLHVRFLGHPPRIGRSAALARANARLIPDELGDDVVAVESGAKLLKVESGT